MSWACTLSCLLIGAVIGGVSSVSSVTEPRKGCVRLNAGLRYRETLYLFHGDQYVQIGDQGQEISIGHLTEWGDQLKGPIDAAIQWSGNYDYYFFKGPDYYSYRLGMTFGPYPSGYWWDVFFDKGIDAAGNIDGVGHFFKGCKYRTWGSLFGGISGEMTLPENLPCGLDAAWDLDGDWKKLVVLKDEKVWIWGKQRVEGPYEFSSFYKMSTWRLCRTGENMEAELRSGAFLG